MKIYKLIIILIGSCLFCQCADYLDVVPDNVATLDITFNNRASAERYLITCYSYIPQYDNLYGNPGLSSGNETWYYTAHDNTFSNRWTYYIALGFQNTQDPLANYWDGANGGKSLFQAIRDCNTFLEYASDRSRIAGLSEPERKRWLAEANVLKAYFHYYLLQLYGPVPIADKNIPVDALPEEVKVARSKVDEVVKYIVDLIDSSYRELPPSIIRTVSELGRLTQPAALAIKAKVLLLAASPLFNGNTDFANFKDHDGEPFFNQNKETKKWEDAAQAALEAIESAETNGHALYYFSKDWAIALPDELLYGMNVRGAVTQRYNNELVWGIGAQSSWDLQIWSQARLLPAMRNAPDNHLFGAAKATYAPTLATAERFYSKNGVPIEEDKEWAANGWYNDRYEVQTITDADKYNMKVGGETAILNFNREYRFYGSLGFDNATWYGVGWTNPDDDNTKNYILGKRGEFGGLVTTGYYSITGYYAKKLCHVENEVEQNVAMIPYPFPIVRLADLYLMYAEALNEATIEGSAVEPDVYTYIDKIRERSGLKGVVESWRESSTNPDKPATPSGMKNIIQRERLIELALEGQHFFDIRRWKLATREFSRQIQGWNILGETIEDYYQVKTIYTPKIYLNKQYIWPVKDYNIIINPKLIQSYGW
jgi:hypothetical protein